MTATETERAGFLQAICSKPLDDTPRLVYADWLDDHGEPERAEFIRVQVELAKLGPPRKRLGMGIGGPAWLRPVGPGVYTWMGDDDVAVEVGERVDVVVHPVAFKGRKKGKRLAHGLVITRVEDRGSDGVHFVARKDEGSKPWAGEPLRRRERELFRLRCPDAPERYLVGTWLLGGRVWTYGGDGEPLSDSLWYPTAPDGATPYRVEIARGFVSQITCPADVWLRQAEKIAWRPGWSAECGTCGGRGTYLPAGRDYGGPVSPFERCHWCDATGRVPRPFPATAQPIEKVTLTGLPDEIGVRVDGMSGRVTVSVVGGPGVDVTGRFAGGPVDDPVAQLRAYCAAVWPGVAFDTSRAA